LPVVGGFVGKELQGDVSTDLQVFRHIHHPADAFRLCAFERSEIGNYNNGAASRQIEESSV
jgi:hypothetical protein